MDIKKIKKTFLISNVIYVNCFLQMFFLPNKAVNIFAFWKASSFLMFCIYYIFIYLKIYIGKENNAKFFNLKDNLIYYTDLLVKLAIILFAYLYINIFRENEYNYLFIFIQVILVGIDVFLKNEILKIFKEINLKNKKSNTINVKPFECTKIEYNNFSKVVLLTLFVIFVEAIYLFVVFISTKLSIFIFVNNTIVLLLFHYLTTVKYDFKRIIGVHKLVRFLFFNLIYNIFELYYILNMDGEKDLKIIFISILSFMIFNLIYMFYPLIRKYISMDEFLKNQGENK
jgi:hypothetical protein